MKKINAIFLIFFALNIYPEAAIGAGFDFSDWDILLNKYTVKGTKENVKLILVNYSQLRKDQKFKNLISGLGSFPLNNLNTYNEKLSFWINVYNIMAAKLISDHYPVKSIKDIGSWFDRVWNKNVGVVGGKSYSLNDIEHGILRKMGEPRIHAAIVCASISCPDLSSESYKPEILLAQLDSQTKRFLENESKGLVVNQRESAVYISSIFKWFKKDFKKSGGVITFLIKYTPKKKKRYLKYLEKGDFSIKYFKYNWGLNEYSAAK